MIPRRPDLDDLDREIRDHIEAEMHDNVAQGMSEDEARAAAIRKFGNVARVKEDVRAVWIADWLDQLRQDARDAVRYMRRNPAFSLAIVVTLVLGIGLCTAIYSVVSAVLLRPLAYAHPERMVWLSTRAKDSSRDIMNSIDFAVWQSQATTLEHMIAYDNVDATLVVGGEASRLRIVSASKGFWEVTGAQPVLGTLPTAADPEALAITHRAFVGLFQSNPSVIGRAVSVDGRPATIAAVLPEAFHPQLQTFGVIVDLNSAEPAAYRMLRVDPPSQVITPTTGVRIYQAIGELKAGHHDRAGARRDRRYSDPGTARPPNALRHDVGRRYTVAGQDCWPVAARAGRPAIGIVLRAADYLRQRREPAAVARRRATQGDCCADVRRLRTVARRPPIVC